MSWRQVLREVWVGFWREESSEGKVEGYEGGEVLVYVSLLEPIFSLMFFSDEEWLGGVMY